LSRTELRLHVELMLGHFMYYNCCGENGPKMVLWERAESAKFATGPAEMNVLPMFPYDFFSDTALREPLAPEATERGLGRIKSVIATKRKVALLRDFSAKPRVERTSTGLHPSSSAVHPLDGRESGAAKVNIMLHMTGELPTIKSYKLV
jgi:hypothetical protein